MEVVLSHRNDHDSSLVNAPAHLGVEHLGAAVLGLGDRRPRVSWRLPAGATRQEAYAIEIDGRDLGRTESDGSVLVPWPGERLRSRQRVSWRVKVWSDDGESEWSLPAWFETGLLEATDWAARWIEPAEDGRSAHVLRQTFRLDAPVPWARLYATAHGIYEAFLNGVRVGDVELAPGFTSYPSTLHVQVYDVGDLLLPGENEWEVVLSDGWWRGRTGFFQVADGYGGALAFLGELQADGVVISTGPGWESATGTLRSADLMAGQSEDHRKSPPLWRGRHGRRRRQTRVPGLFPGAADPQGAGAAACRRHAAGVRPPGGRPRASNINGWLRLCDVGPTGTELTIVHGEFLDPSGDVTQAGPHLSPDFLGGDMKVGMTDHVVAAGTPGEVFEPRHTTHGFRSRIEGHPNRLHSRRRHWSGRPYGLAPYGVVPLQRRAVEPAARHHRMVVPGQRLRNPDGLPASAKRRMDGGLAAVRPDRCLSLRRRGVLPQVAPGRRGRAAP